MADSLKTIDLSTNAEENNLLARNDVIGFYTARLARGDAYASLALDVVNNTGLLGTTANLWMFTHFNLANNQKSQHLNNGSYVDFIRKVNIGLANAHADRVNADRINVKGLLSAEQITDYHENFFDNAGFKFKSAFGGSFFFGFRTDYWCKGCDVEP